MAKITANTDLVPTNGRWVWKDEPLGLEFISNTLITDKGKRGKKHEAKGKDRAASSRAIGRGRGLTHMGNARGQQLKKELFEHNTVLLEDIKSVAFDMISEVETLPESFGGVLRAPQFDYFLLHLLSYFKCYFEKRKQENKKHPMCVEPSPSEKKALAVVTEKLQAAQKLLGRSYCSLVLGLGLEKQHHMECGSSRVSATYKDRGIFETLYNFCTYVVWITFRRKEFEVIKKEIGRMLRSDTFNPAIRVKYSSDEMEPKEKKVDENVDTQPIEKLSPAQYRRLHPKRPPIKSIIHQRSPAIVSILPSPKEEAHWLFKRRHDYIATLAGMTEDDYEDIEEQFRDLIIDVKKFRVGILGEPYKLFNHQTLCSMGAEIEDEDVERADGEKETREEAGVEKSVLSDHGILSRQATAISHATTDVHTDDEG